MYAFSLPCLDCIMWWIDLILVLTQNVHLAPSTQQAEQAGFTSAENHKSC
jgi:hypothetical protein